MPRKLRIAAACLAAATLVVTLTFWAAYRATRQVQPFYSEALALDPSTLERGKQELESRATTLYSDTRQTGTWRAQFTDEQINGWLATELADQGAALGLNPSHDIREPRIAIGPDRLTLGFRTTQRGVDTVVTVEASVFLVDESEVAVRVERVRAGALPLPVAMIAEQLAAACQRLKLPVLWTQQDDQPVAMIKIGQTDNEKGRRLCLDTIELTNSQLYVSGHTETTKIVKGQFNANKLELHLAPSDNESMLEIAQRDGEPHRKGTPHREGEAPAEPTQPK